MSMSFINEAEHELYWVLSHRFISCCDPSTSETERRVLADSRRKSYMAKLTSAKKNAEPKKEFGLPEERKYPMPDKSHARNAKARASQMEHQGKLSASSKKKIDAKADKVLGK
jgi:hypothetical protein